MSGLVDSATACNKKPAEQLVDGWVAARSADAAQCY